MPSATSAPHYKRLLYAIAIAIPAALLVNIGSFQLAFEEPRRALVALEMLIRDNWIVPTTNGVLYYNKPPLYNWVLMAMFWLFGSAEWVIRLPGIVSLLATAIVHYQFAKTHIGRQAALVSALFYITSADILFYFSYLGEIDLFYSFVVYLQAACMFYFAQHKKWHWLYLSSYLLAAVGTLVKGVPSIFFQGITLLVVMAVNRDLRRLFSVWHVTGLLLFTLITGSYFYAYSLQHDVWPFLARLYTETFDRTPIERTFADTLRHLLLNFPLMVLKISAPWCLLFLLTIKSDWKQALKSNHYLQFSLWFVVANGLLYWVSAGTRERYLYMFFPFIYNLLAYFLFEKNTPVKRKGLNWLYYFIASIVFSGLAALCVIGLINQLIAGAVCCALLLAGLVFTVLKCKKEWHLDQHLLAAVLFVLIGRLGFNLCALPLRKQDEQYRYQSQKIASVAGRQPVLLTGSPQMQTDTIRFGKHIFAEFCRDEPAYLDFQTSFYYSQASSKVLKYVPFARQKALYLQAQHESIPKTATVLYAFSNFLNGEKKEFVLFAYPGQLPGTSSPR